MKLEQILGRIGKRILADLVKAEIARAKTHAGRNPSVAAAGKVDQLNELHTLLTTTKAEEKKG